jgi:hypothetical protein
MPSHLASENLMGVLDGTVSAPERDHVASCATCRALLEEARAGLALAEDGDVPEPSPLYWESLRRQVGRRIETHQRRTWAFRLLPLFAAAAALVLVLPSLRVAPPPTPAPAPALPAWSPLPPADEDPGLQVLSALAVSTPDLALGDCTGVTECASELSEDESGELLQALRDELARKGEAL